MIGVSPAYFLSRSGPGFGPRDIMSGLPFLSDAGYQSFQAEVFLESALRHWRAGAPKAVADCARAHGLRCNIFVAHFLGGFFSSASSLNQGFPLDQARTAVDLASAIFASSSATISALDLPPMAAATLGRDKTIVENHGIFVVPVPAFIGLEAPRLPQSGDKSRTERASQVRDRVGTLLSLCHAADLRLALELLPGNILGGPDDFLRLAAQPGFSELGLLLDTGHFWAMGVAVQDLPWSLGRHIIATHLCDNNGLVNLSLCPGDGTIPFELTIRKLLETGYSGGLDLEIVCPRDQVESEYRRGFSQFSHLIKPTLTEATSHPDQLQAAGSLAFHTTHKETI